LTKYISHLFSSSNPKSYNTASFILSCVIFYLQETELAASI